MSMYIDAEGNERAGRMIWHAIIAVVFVVLASMAGCPIYNVWEQGLAGQAALRRAEQDRQIAVQEAQAKRDAAGLLAEAEILRAKGVAQANTIIGEGLKNHEEYLRYLWIMSLEHVASANGSTVVYVPTEAGLPILEAQRLTNRRPADDASAR